MVTIAIEDNGIGIPKDALRKLGRPFEQVESQLTKTHQGSGLGLAIAKSLAELHGGAMRIRSTLGDGTMRRRPPAAGRQARAHANARKPLLLLRPPLLRPRPRSLSASRKYPRRCSRP